MTPVPTYHPLDRDQCETLVRWLALDGECAALVRLAAREGARVRLGSCEACYYVFVDGAVTDAVRVAMRMHVARRPDNPIFDWGVPRFTEPDPSTDSACKPHACEGPEVYTLVV